MEKKIALGLISDHLSKMLASLWGGEAPFRNLRYLCLAPVPCPQFTRTIYAYDLRIYAYEIRKLLR